MPRYRFHLIECGQVIDGPEGFGLADMQAAIRVAIRQIRGILSQEIFEDGKLDLARSIDISGQGEIHRLAFRDAVMITE